MSSDTQILSKQKGGGLKEGVFGQPRKAPKISVVAPMHNEEGNAKHLYQAIKNAVDPLGIGYEIIFVNDASDDRTFEVLKKIQKEDPNFHYCDLRHNVGENWALLAGVSVAKGDTIVTIDGDFQNDPKFIPALLQELKKGFQVVSGWRKNRAGGVDRTLPSVVANYLISKISGVPIHDCGCGLKAYRREVLAGKFVPKGFMNRFSPVVFGIKADQFREIEVTDRLRTYGKSHYGTKRVFIVFNDLLALPYILRGVKKSFPKIRVLKRLSIGGALISGTLAATTDSFLGIWAGMFLLAFAGAASVEWNLSRFLEAETTPHFKIKEFSREPAWNTTNYA